MVCEVAGIVSVAPILRSFERIERHTGSVGSVVVRVIDEIETNAQRMIHHPAQIGLIHLLCPPKHLRVESGV
jgi:hypothetical protein